MGTFFSSRNLEKSMIKAVYGNNTDFLKFLIQKGADVNSQSNNKIKSEILDISILSGKKNTPLIFASFYGNYEVAEVLIDNKADVNIRNIDGKDALMIAISGKKKDICRLLLNSRSNLSNIDRYGETIFHKFAFEPNYEICELAFSKIHYKKSEKLLNKRNNTGILALIVLASKGNEKMCILYVRNGANPFLINGSGKSGYYFAREFGFAKKLVDAHNEFNGMRKK